MLARLEKEQDWCKDLGAGMCVKRRVEGGGPSDILKQTKHTGLFWHMFVWFLDEGDLKDSRKIGTAWGFKVAGTMNRYFLKHVRRKGQVTITLKIMSQMGWRSQLKRSAI